MQAIATIQPKAPYDFDLTASFATHYRGRYGAESFEEGVFRRLLEVDGRLVLVSVRSLGTLEAPRLEIGMTGESPDEATTSEACRQVSRILGVDNDLASFYRMAQLDAVLAPLVNGLPGLALPQTASVYEALVTAILGQQINAHVARMLRTLLIETYGRSLEEDGVAYQAFPEPQALMEAGVDGLRAIKFSGRKAEYIVGIATQLASGELDLEGLRSQPDEDVVRVLTGLRGVGLWTAQWLFIRALGRPDGFPHGDLALQRALGLLVNGGTPMSPEEALDYSLRWSPYRSYVTTYLFAAIRSGRLASLAGADQVGP